MEGLGQLKNPVTSLGIEPATFWLVALTQPTTLIKSQICILGYVIQEHSFSFNH
jgi:hypothetical protein